MGYFALQNSGTEITIRECVRPGGGWGLFNHDTGFGVSEIPYLGA